MNNIFLVIPTYNESSRLYKLLDKTKTVFPPERTIVVDDGSTTPAFRKKYKNIFLRHDINLGKGAAMRTGAIYAFSHQATAVLFMDSDGQHNPSEIPKFINEINHGSDLVFGIRSFGHDAPLIRLLGRKLTSVYIRLLFGVYVADILSGYRAISRRGYKKIAWESNRYEVETEIVIKLGKARKSLKWSTVPIETIYEFKYKGMTVVDGIKLILHSLYWRLF